MPSSGYHGNYRNWFVTHNISFTWTYGKRFQGHGLTMGTKSLKALPICSSKWCFMLQTDSYNLWNIAVKEFSKIYYHSNVWSTVFPIPLASQKFQLFDKCYQTYYRDSWNSWDWMNHWLKYLNLKCIRYNKITNDFSLPPAFRIVLPVLCWSPCSW